MGNIHIRFAEDGDNDRILELSKRCPQEGMVTFFVNRTPRYNTLHRLLDPHAWHLVACMEDRIIGLVGIIHFNARILDKPHKVGFMLDLRIEPAYRNGLSTFRLIKAAADRILQSDVDMVIVNILKNNNRPLSLISGRTGLPAARYIGDNRIFNILPMKFMRLNQRFEIDEPTANDIPEIIELYRSYGSKFKIAPLITVELFNHYLTVIEGFDLSNFLIARENGKIKAITGMWNEHTYKSYQVLQFNSAIKFTMRTLKFLSLFMRAPQPIKLNEPLRQLSLVLYAHDNCPQALETLFRHANNINLGSDFTFISLYAHESDPLFGLLKGFNCVNVKSEMHLFAKDATVLDELINNHAPVQLDLAMIL